MYNKVAFKIIDVSVVLLLRTKFRIKRSLTNTEIIVN